MLQSGVMIRVHVEVAKNIKSVVGGKIFENNALTTRCTGLEQPSFLNRFRRDKKVCSLFLCCLMLSQPVSKVLVRYEA
jgi:hypothetical protein